METRRYLDIHFTQFILFQNDSSCFHFSHAYLLFDIVMEKCFWMGQSLNNNWSLNMFTSFLIILSHDKLSPNITTIFVIIVIQKAIFSIKILL
jgi:hypothetical protein